MKRRCSQLRPDWLNPRLEDEFLLLPNTMVSFTNSIFLEVIDRFHTVYTPRFPHNLGSASIRTSHKYTQATSATWDTDFGYNFTRRSAMPLDEQRQVCFH